MAKSSKQPKSKIEKARALPWAAALQVVVVVGRRWRNLSEKDRARAGRLVRESRGRLGNLSSKERQELRRIAGKLDLRGMAGDLVSVVRGGRGRRGRRRGA